MGGAVIVFHPDGLVVFLAAVLLCLVIIAKGARLKWKAERRTEPSAQPPAAGAIYVQPQAGATVNFFIGSHAQPVELSEPNPGVNVGDAPGLQIIQEDPSDQVTGEAGGQPPEESGAAGGESN